MGRRPREGSGGDLRTAGREFFSSLYQDKLVGLQKSYGARTDKGLKSQAEDDMVAAYSHTTFNLNPRPSSIDTPLHSFVPGKHVDHMHPNAIISIDLEKQEIRGPDGGMIKFEVDDFRKQCLLNGWDDIGLTMRNENKISSFEAQHKTQTPWI